MPPLSTIKGVDSSLKSKLKSIGLTSVPELLEACATKTDREALAKALHISELEVLNLAHLADLTRIKGIGHDYAEVLKATGFDTVKKLAAAKPENIFSCIIDINMTRHIVRRIPTLNRVYNWVRQAIILPKILED